MGSHEQAATAGRHVRSGAFPLPELAALDVDPAGLLTRGRALLDDPDARRRGADRMLVGLTVFGNVTALSLSVLSWAWLRTHGTGDQASATTGTRAAPDHLAALIPGPTLVLLLLLAGALMAPAVNPFYSGPTARRLLHRITVGSFAVLVATAVSVVAVAAS